MNETMIIEIGPPKIIPKVPVKNITIALDPNFLISGISMLIVSKANFQKKMEQLDPFTRGLIKFMAEIVR